MIKHIKKNLLIAVLVSAGAVSGLASCNEGTKPGDTNTERSSIKEADEMNTGNNTNRDTAQDMERHYDHADSAGGAVHAGDGQGNGVERDEVKQ